MPAHSFAVLNVRLPLICSHPILDKLTVDKALLSACICTYICVHYSVHHVPYENNNCRDLSGTLCMWEIVLCADCVRVSRDAWCCSSGKENPRSRTHKIKKAKLSEEG